MPGPGMKLATEATLRMPPRCRARLGDEAERQLGEHADVEVDHGELLLAVEARGEAHQTEAGVVDQELRLKAALAQLILDPRRGIGLAEIDDDDMRPRVAALLDRVGQRLELRRAPRGEHERVAVVGEHVGQRRADAGGGAGDQGDGFGVRHDVRDRKTSR